MSDDDMALDLGALMRALGQSLRWLLPLSLLVGGLVLTGLQFLPSKYMGEARILIESTNINIPGTPRGVEEERALLDSEGVASQTQLLMATDLARRVARKLDLASEPEFGARDGGIVSDSLLTLIGFRSNPAGDTGEERVLKHYFKNLDVYRLEDSRVIAVDYSAQDPLLAAAVANTIVDEYLVLQSSAKRQTTELTSAALEPQIVELRREVQTARQAVADFRAQADLLIGADNIPLNQQQLAETSTDHSAAQATKAEAQAKADLIRELLNSGASLETASDVLNSQLIQRLRERQVAIQSNIAELSITLLPNHPQIRALQSQLRDYDRQIRSEASKILQGLENDARVANQQALALERRLEDLKVAAARSNADQARLSELEREADAKADQLDQLMRSFQETDSRLRAQILPADARIVSRANVPVEPFSPRILATSIVAALATLIIGSAFVIMRELLSGRALHSASGQTAPVSAMRDPAGGFTWAPSYGQGYQSYRMQPGLRPTVPPDEGRSDTAVADEPVEEEVSRTAPFKSAKPGTGPHKRTGNAPSEQTYDRNVSPDWLARSRAGGDGGSSEGLGTKAANDQAAAPVRPDRIDPMGRIVVLSVDEPDLSHDLAFDLARKAAGEGRSALFMEVFPEQDNPRAAEGFSDIVAGNAPFAKVVYRDAVSTAHIIEAGRVAISDEMVDTDRFKLALEAIRSTYDAILLDLGAIDGTLASARILSFADRVLIVASAPDETSELDAAAALLAHNTGANVEVVISEAPRSDPRHNGSAA